MIDPRMALEAIGQLPDDEIELADAAFHLARIDAPDADWPGALGHLSLLARQASQLAQPIGAHVTAERAAQLAGLLVNEHGYRGDSETYDDLRNANLIQVMDRRRGLPVALGILWLHCARAAGWEADGLDVPGHFLISLHGPGTPVVVDVFNGGMVLSAAELRPLLSRRDATRPRSDAASERHAGPNLPRRVDNRAVLLRLQNNIATRRLQAGDEPGALTCLEDMLRFAPEAAAIWREAAQLHSRLGQLTGALHCFERFLALAPSPASARIARAAMDELRSRLT